MGASATTGAMTRDQKTYRPETDGIAKKAYRLVSPTVLSNLIPYRTVSSKIFAYRTVPILARVRGIPYREIPSVPP